MGPEALRTIDDDDRADSAGGARERHRRWKEAILGIVCGAVTYRHAHDMGLDWFAGHLGLFLIKVDLEKKMSGEYENQAQERVWKTEEVGGRENKFFD